MPKCSIIAALYLTLISHVYAQTGWVTLNSGTNLILNDIQFIDASTGYFCAGHIINSTGVVRKTTDGGTSWTTVLNLSAQLRGISFIDANTGTVVGEYTVRRTTNGGVNWTIQTVPVGASSIYNSVYFLNLSVGMIVGALNSNADGSILYTSDGGNSWFNRGYGHDAVYFDVQVFDANTAIVVTPGGASGTIIKTTNTGINWIILSTGGAYRGLSFIDNNNGMVSGAGSNNLGKTTNGGNNWNFQTISSTFSLEDIKYIDQTSGFTVGSNGAIWRTTNSGTNWIQQTSGTTRYLNSVFFINPNTGWICGDTGILIKTTTGGITPIQPTGNIIPKSYLLEQNYPNPFNPTTKIKFEIPKTDLTTLKIYDVLGSEAAVLVNEELKPGTYQAEWDASSFPSGVYFYKIASGEYSETKKMVLLK